MEYSMDRMPVYDDILEAADAWVDSDPAAILNKMPDAESVTELAVDELLNIYADNADDPRFSALLDVSTDVAIEALVEAIEGLL